MQIHHFFQSVAQLLYHHKQITLRNFPNIPNQINSAATLDMAVSSWAGVRVIEGCVLDSDAAIMLFALAFTPNKDIRYLNPSQPKCRKLVLPTYISIVETAGQLSC